MPITGSDKPSCRTARASRDPRGLFHAESRRDYFRWGSVRLVMAPRSSWESRAFLSRPFQEIPGSLEWRP